MWQALAGVLHMSELKIEEADHEEGPVAAITDREVGTCTLKNTS